MCLKEAKKKYDKETEKYCTVLEKHLSLSAKKKESHLHEVCILMLLCISDRTENSPVCCEWGLWFGLFFFNFGLKNFHSHFAHNNTSNNNNNNSKLLSMLAVKIQFDFLLIVNY